jgi:hypothetical protein
MARNTLIIGLLALALAGCQATPGPAAPPAATQGGQSNASYPSNSKATTPSTVADRPAAYVNSQPLAWGELQQALLESAGGQVLLE